MSPLLAVQVFSDEECGQLDNYVRLIGRNITELRTVETAPFEGFKVGGQDSHE